VIGALEGIVAGKDMPQLLLDVHGICYEIETPLSTFLELPALGARLRLLTHLVVREDAQVLYGFATAAERQLFRSLLKVSGVGPRMALAILSGVTVNVFGRCVRERDVATLTRIPGVGRKTAERLIVEMRDRLDGAKGGAAVEAPAGATGAQAEAWSALLGLGYKPAEATRMLAGTGAGSTEDLIRRALQGVAHE